MLAILLFFFVEKNQECVYTKAADTDKHKGIYVPRAVIGQKTVEGNEKNKKKYRDAEIVKKLIEIGFFFHCKLPSAIY